MIENNNQINKWKYLHKWYWKKNKYTIIRKLAPHATKKPLKPCLDPRAASLKGSFLCREQAQDRRPQVHSLFIMHRRCHFGPRPHGCWELLLVPYSWWIDSPSVVWTLIRWLLTASYALSLFSIYISSDQWGNLVLMLGSGSGSGSGYPSCKSLAGLLLSC